MGTLHFVVCLTPQLVLPVYLHANVVLLGPPAAALPASCSFAHPMPQSTTSLVLPVATLLRVLSAQLPVSAPPAGLDQCFFFNSLVVGLPYSSIFWQFWLFFVFKFVVVLLLVV